MVGSGAREDGELHAGIARWLDTYGIVTATNEAVGGPFTVGPLSRPATGLSSDTAFVTASTGGHEHHLVVRLAPAGDGLFRQYDLGAQVLMQNALARAGVPTAAPARYEADRSWLGDPFMVMPRVAGRVVNTRPSYTQAGWLAESEPSFQAALLDDFLRTLAELHRQNRAIVDAPVVVAADAFAGACDYLDWASGGAVIPEYLVEARAWCSREVPVSISSPSVLWGDVQFANCVFTEAGAVAALLDFELAGAGPAEMDLGWFLALHDMTANLAGRDLPGFGDRRSMVAAYEAALGRAVEALDWYEMFALLRSGSIMVRMARLSSRHGIDDGWLYRDNPTEAAVARVLTRA